MLTAGVAHQEIPGMVERELHRWQIYVLRAEAQHLGVVEASDYVSAIEAARKKFAIEEGDRRKLFARRMD
jgi:hypothetical protein